MGWRAWHIAELADHYPMAELCGTRRLLNKRVIAFFLVTSLCLIVYQLGFVLRFFQHSTPADHKDGVMLSEKDADLPATYRSKWDALEKRVTEIESGHNQQEAKLKAKLESLEQMLPAAVADLDEKLGELKESAAKNSSAAGSDTRRGAAPPVTTALTDAAALNTSNARVESLESLLATHAAALNASNARMESLGTIEQVVIDCTHGTFDLVLNAILCLAAATNVSSAVSRTRVLCMDSSCCAAAQQAGFHVLHRSSLQELSHGFDLQNIGYETAHLDTVMLTRELYILQLLEKGVDVLRMDADICLRTDLFRVAQSEQLDILISGQPMDVGSPHGWGFRWACPEDHRHPGHTMTLNNGFGLLKGTNPLVVAHYAAGIGRSFSLAMNLGAQGRDGWGQRGFNIQMNESGLCLRPGNKSSACEGKGMTAAHATLGQVRVGVFSVGSPCSMDRALCQKPSTAICRWHANWQRMPPMATHANCLYGNKDGLTATEFIADGMQRKRAYLKSRGEWLLHPELTPALLGVPSTGDAEAYLRALARLWPPEHTALPGLANQLGSEKGKPSVTRVTRAKE